MIYQHLDKYYIATIFFKDYIGYTNINFNLLHYFVNYTRFTILKKDILTTGAHITHKAHGLGLHFFKQLIQVNLNQNAAFYLHKRDHASVTLIPFFSRTALVTYNTSALFMQFYNLFLFFINAGKCNSSFMTVTNEIMRDSSFIMNYFFINQFNRRGFKRDAFYDVLPQKFCVEAYKPLKFDVDFLFMVDGAIKEHIAARISRTPTHVIGITSNLYYARYYDTLILIETNSSDIQLYFIELATYAYLYGRRTLIRVQLTNTIDLLSSAF